MKLISASLLAFALLQPTGPAAPALLVQALQTEPDERWYFVETPEGERGWISDKFTVADICIG